MLKNLSFWQIAIATVALAYVPMFVVAKDPVIRPSSGRLSDRAASGPSESVQSNLIEGFTEPYADINMAAAEMGTLSRVEVKDGDEVRVGQVLANLDDAVLRASLEVARAGMTATGEMQSATTQLELKKVELTKLTELFNRNHASQQELDRVRGEVRLSESRIQSVREDLEVRRLEFARIEAQILQRQIRSTIDGVVVDVRKDHGEFVSPSDPVVARIVQLDPLLVVFSVPNNFRNGVSRGQSVNMNIGAMPNAVAGVVEYVSPTADASSGTFRVKVRLPNPNRTWHGGEKSVLLLNGASPGNQRGKQLAKNEKS